jgi:hypothetical protein
MRWLFSYAFFLWSSSVDERMTNECGKVDGMKIGWGTEVFGENQAQCHLIHKSHMT